MLADGRHGIFVSSRELKAQDVDSRDEEVVFSIIRQPYFGYLENTTTGQDKLHIQTFFSRVWNGNQPVSLFSLCQGRSCPGASPKQI